ncbi:hypothetical protein ACLKA6_013598 [Drosophila palustris]
MLQSCKDVTTACLNNAKGRVAGGWQMGVAERKLLRNTQYTKEQDGSFRPIELRPQLAAEARGMAMLQQRMMLELVQRHKQIPRLTYFTCRNPANNDTGNVRANRGQRNLQQLRAAFDAKNLQLIESLNEASGAFLRIVLLDVLSQGEARKGAKRQGQRGHAAGQEAPLAVATVAQHSTCS